MSGSTTQPPRAPVLSTDFDATTVPGVFVTVDPDEAANLGAFEETALTEADAWDSNADLPSTEGAGV